MSSLFPSCAETARRLSEAQDHPLSLGARCGVAIHLFLCRFCRRYRRQLMFLRSAYQSLNTEQVETSDIRLSPEARQRIVALLNQSR